MSDSEDDVQDWAQLAKLGPRSGAAHPDATMLKRGEKDFEPDGTRGQVSALAASREAMYAALSQPRAHHTLMRGDWDTLRQETRIDKPVGTHLFKMGYAAGGVSWLGPEETIYLVQRGSLIVYANGHALSVQGVCALCFAAVAPARVLVYSHLKKLGYVVMVTGRPGSWTGTPDHAEPVLAPRPAPGRPLLTLLTSPWHAALAWRPFYTSFDSIFRDLRVVGTACAPAPPAEAVDFHVWKPATQYRKRDVPLPDYFVKVVDVRSEPVPTLARSRALFAGIPRAPSTRRSAVARVREGLRTATLGLVDSGMISFVRLVDTEMEVPTGRA